MSLRTNIRSYGFAGILSFAAFLLSACVIDRSIYVEPNDTKKSFRVIDGDVEVATGGRVQKIRVIDGDITLNQDATATGRVYLTDGSLFLKPGTQVEADIVVHHGTLDMNGTTILGDVDVFCSNGAIKNTEIQGTLTIRKRALWHVKCDRSQVFKVGPNTRINTLLNESKQAVLDVDESSEIAQKAKTSQLSLQTQQFIE